MSTDKKVALVTGASRGLGRALAEHLVGLGYIVIGCGRTPPSGGPLPFTYETVDVTDEAHVTRLIKEVGRKHGQLDVLINNAGIAAMNPVLLMPLSAARKIVDTNFLGAFLVCREGAKLMMRRRYGRMVNISTVAVPMNVEGEAVYAASKAALEKFTKIFAREVADFGITVNAIGPAPMETDLIRHVPREKIEALVQRLAIKRLGTVRDLAKATEFYIDPAADYITGQVLYLGGPD